ncbi:hypothetical protein D9758_007760 [Tetrapyrgos nigripes]|uniref:Uncharacterized protein n=1 Tax=Tetrapyrgos nigripes TaxID=182062 RepID=A0A8H5G5C0_9AGAR|nr:hypothetical protein D9758_007760 [Tetrapyrgos nigripes]
MSTPRLSTVYDLSSLRLHTDGSSVSQTDKNRQPRRSKLSVRDSRGNWIAKDAGGLGNVPHRYRPETGSPPNYYPNLGQDHDESGNRRRDGGESDERSPVERTYKTHRAKVRAEKRRKFGNDFGFLTSTPDTISPLSRDDNDSSHIGSVSPSWCDPPSSDLLKCIHYLASRYYDEQGQLTNSSRQYRKEKKQRRLARLVKDRLQAARKAKSTKRWKQGGSADDSDGDDVASGSGCSSPQPETNHHSDGGEDSDLGSVSGSSSEEDPEPNTEPEMDAESPLPLRSNTKAKAKAKAKVPKKMKQNRITDMYKTMDGSALMVIGISLSFSHFCLSTLAKNANLVAKRNYPRQNRQIGMLLQEHVSGTHQPWLAVDADKEEEEDIEIEADTGAGAEMEAKQRLK